MMSNDFCIKAGKNILTVLIYRLLLVVFLFALCRIGFYIFNIQMFPGVTFSQFILIMKGGLIFDISAILYINLLIIILSIIPFDFRYNVIYQKVTMYLFFLFNGVAIALNTADYVYYRFVFKRATADVFGTFENEAHLEKMFFSFLFDYWPATLFCIFLWFLMVFLYRKIKPEKPVMRRPLLYHAFNVLIIPVILGLTIAGARGGFRHSTRPITISNAAKFVATPRDVPIVLNTPFSILRTFGKKPLERYNFYPQDQLDSLFNPHHKPLPAEPFRAENVVIIILESMGREYIGSLSSFLDDGKYKGYTPFLDSLVNEGLTFTVSLSNGKKSIDAMPSVLASLPSLETPYIISHYANNKIDGLATHLKRKGYYTAFFHGAPNGSMGFDSFARMAGFDNYFGLNEYPGKDDFDGMWGVWDEPFMNFFGDKLNEMPQPFIVSFFSISSHHPFRVPEKYEGRFPKGDAPIVEVVGYTDYALREFFGKVSGEEWFNNTLFVFTADHTNESLHKEFQNDFGSYSVPVLLYKHGSNLKGVKENIAQQVDIMPTVLDYLNYDEDYIAFGKNLLSDSTDSFAINTNGSTYHIYMDDHILTLIGMEPAGLFNYKTDRFLEENLLGQKNEIAEKLERKLKAVIQSYNSRLLDNNLIVRKDD